MNFPKCKCGRTAIREFHSRIYKTSETKFDRFICSNCMEDIKDCQCEFVEIEQPLKCIVNMQRREISND